MPLRSETRFISLNDLQSGMMATFVYTKPTGESEQYTILVIDPSITNKTTQNIQLHGLLIDDLNDFDLFTLAVKLGDGVRFDPDNRAQPLTALNTDEAYQKYATEFKHQKRYRIFTRNKISKLRQILIGELT